jgi:phosphoribosylformimino-5-aminoimidazole carboxamide ribotide isomerase
VERIIVGTRAVSDFNWLKKMSEKFAGKIALGLDARGSRVATHGWTRESEKDVLEFAVEAAGLPLAAIIYTDITKDGMLSGPNLERIGTLVKAVQLPVIAAGGVSTVDDIKNLKQVGVEAAIIGRGLYEKTIKLADAIEAAQ